MKLSLLVITFLVLFNSMYSQNKNSTDEKSNEIIIAARKAIGINEKKIISFSFKIRDAILTKTDAGENLPASTNELSVILPDKIQTIWSVTEPFSSISTHIWNGENYKSFMELEIMGQRTVKDTTNSVSNNESYKVLEGKMPKDKLDALRNSKRPDPKVSFNEDIWIKLFPLILENPFEKNLEFNYIGKAQAGDKTANVIDFKPKNGKTYRLLFDTETNYLLMMIVNYKRDDPFFTGDVETKYYYSNREKFGDILIPKTIKVENKQTASGQSPKIGYAQIDVLDFKLNPEFKKDLFEIK